MNRQQRRAAEKAQRHNRAAGMGRAGSLAEATLSDWLRRGAIRSTTAVGGLPAYGVAR